MSFNCEHEIMTLQKELSLQTAFTKKNKSRDFKINENISNNKTEKEIYKELLTSYLIHKAGLSKNVGINISKNINNINDKIIKLYDPIIQYEN